MKHEDVSDSLEELLGESITCAYVQIPQHGFHGCFSTQRKIRSPVDLQHLPHFVEIASEGKVYRAFLFVPGRPTVRFNCGRVGHMRGSCPGKDDETTFKRPSSSPVEIPPAKQSRKDHATEEDMSMTHSDVEQASPNACYQPSEDDFESQSPSQGSPTFQTFLIKRYKLVITQGDKATDVTKKGKVIVVRPPNKSSMAKKQITLESKSCDAGNCRLVNNWAQERISLPDMINHVENYHSDLLSVVQC